MLQLDGITRSFGDRKVLDRVSFSVAPGNLTGFVGGNGAGKVRVPVTSFELAGAS